MVAPNYLISLSHAIWRLVKEILNNRQWNSPISKLNHGYLSFSIGETRLLKFVKNSKRLPSLHPYSTRTTTQTKRPPSLFSRISLSLSPYKMASSSLYSNSTHQETELSNNGQSGCPHRLRPLHLGPCRRGPVPARWVRCQRPGLLWHLPRPVPNQTQQKRCWYVLLKLLPNA